MIDWRLDFKNLPNDVGPKWNNEGYGTFIIDDWSAYRHERAEILDHIRSVRVTGVAAICGDRHAFEAGLVSSSSDVDPIIPEFITASISAPGLFEGAEYSLARDHPLRAIYLYQPPDGGTLQPAVNFSLRHGVRAGLELQRTGDARQALAERNPQLAPNLSFVDLSAHGYAVVRAVRDHLEVEFVCMPRPLESAPGVDGGPVRYRVTHRVDHWLPNTRPKLKRIKVEGTLPVVT